MNKLFGAALAALAFAGVPAHAALLGPSAYLSQADSPFDPASFDYFYLEDLEDNAVNTPGLTVTGPSFCITGFNCFVGAGITDSVENGQQGRSIFTNGSAEIVFSFASLGSLPTAAGLVWTDGNNPIRFEAFDQNNVSLGVLNGTHATAGIEGQKDEDRFYGATNASGILRLTISNNPGTEIDHIQYGGFNSAIPEPASWAMMLVGFGAVGYSMRRRRLLRPVQAV